MFRVLFCACALFPLCIFAQSSYRISQLGHWDNDNLPVQSNQAYNEVYGWYDPIKQKEYAMLCSLDSIYFFDVTSPAQPVLCDVEAGRASSCRNRDVVTYSHYAYAVAGQGLSSLQIFDLQSLPDSVRKVYDHDSLCIRAHTLCVDSNSARLYLCSNERDDPQSGQLISYAATVLSLQDPVVPVFMGNLVPPGGAFNLVHNAQAWKDTLFCSTGNSGLYIFDYRNVNSPQIIGALPSYPEKGYCHSPAFDPAHRLLCFTDENAGLGVKLSEMSSSGQLTVKDVFRSSVPAISHKPYFAYPLVWVSYYHDGLYAFDVRDVNNVRTAAWFDTYDNQGNYSGLVGCWGVYPYLPSGNILASDMLNGLFVLGPDSNVSVREFSVKNVNVYPNPFRDELKVDATGISSLSLYDVRGKLLLQKETEALDQTHILNTSTLSPGFYVLRLVSEESSGLVKVVKY